MYKIGDKIIAVGITWKSWGTGTVTRILPDDDRIGVRFDKYKGYLSTTDFHRVQPDQLRLQSKLHKALE